MTVWEGDGREEECSNKVPCSLQALGTGRQHGDYIEREQVDQQQSGLEELEGRWLARKRKRRNAVTRFPAGVVGPAMLLSRENGKRQLG